MMIEKTNPKRIRSHRDLEVYQMEFAVAMRIFELTKSFPREEKHSMGKLVRMMQRPQDWKV